MVTNPPDRLDRLEALTETILLAIQQQSGQIRQLAEQQRQGPLHQMVVNALPTAIVVPLAEIVVHR